MSLGIFDEGEYVWREGVRGELGKGGCDGLFNRGGEMN
jgi:hypothetical protein